MSMRTKHAPIWYLALVAVAGLSQGGCSTSSATSGDAGNTSPLGVDAGDDGSEQSPDATSPTADAGDAGSVGDANPDGGAGGAATTATMFLSNGYSGSVYRYGLSPGADPVLNDIITSLPAGGSNTQATATGLAMSPWGELFVADLTAGSIYRFLSPLDTPTPNGSITGTGLSYPEEIRFIDNELWAPDTSGSAVQFILVSFDAQYNASAVGISVPGSSSNNRGMLWVPTSRDLYESQVSNTIQHYRIGTDAGVTPLTAITGNGLNNPGGMAMSPWGEMFVTNAQGGNILRFKVDSQGDVTANGSITDSSLNFPYGAAFTPWGDLFVVSQGSGVLTRFTFDSSNAASASGTYQLQGATSAFHGGFAWILIVPGASTNLTEDGGSSDAGNAADAPSE